MSQPTQQPMAPAGWYADNGVLRWWDGGRWTQHVAPAGPAAPPPPSAAPWPTRSPQRRAIVGVALGLGAAFLAVIVVGSIGYAIVGTNPSESQDQAVSLLGGLAATLALIGGCLYGSRKYTRHSPR